MDLLEVQGIWTQQHCTGYVGGIVVSLGHETFEHFSALLEKVLVCGGRVNLPWHPMADGMESTKPTILRRSQGKLNVSSPTLLSKSDTQTLKTQLQALIL